MSMRDDDTFFIGWAKPPGGLLGFLVVVVVCMAIGFGAAAYLLAATQDDPGDGAFRGDFRRQNVTGILTVDPYPIITLDTANERYPEGHAILLSGNGKRGVQDRAAALDGQRVLVSGTPLRRGSIDMIQLRGGRNGLRAEEGATIDVPEPVSLGRWRLTGEVCDGKCYVGAMRPGTGLAHKACANFCLEGGVPPIFVTTVPVDGEEFLLLADAEGGEVTEALLDHTATLVAIEGEVERRGAILVFRIDTETIRLAR